jgi:serine-type D-Ala-D-Ala carboxypeptidase (penicillin-binding protein 5/6)
MATMKERSQEGEKVLEWAYREFNNYHLVKAGEPIDAAPVWMGQTTKVPDATTQDVVVTLPRSSRHDMKVKAEYDRPVTAPVAKGQKVGKLVVSAPDFAPQEFPLVATQPVARLNPMGRVAVAAGYLLWGRHN